MGSPRRISRNVHGRVSPFGERCLTWIGMVPPSCPERHGGSNGRPAPSGEPLTSGRGGMPFLFEIERGSRRPTSGEAGRPWGEGGGWLPPDPRESILFA